MKSALPIIVAALVSQVSAQTIVQSHTIPTYTASGSHGVVFDKFDTLGGSRILNGVTVSFNFDKIGGSYAIDNDSTQEGNITFYHEIKARLTSADVSLGTASTYLSAISEFTTFVGADDGDLQATFNPGGSDYVLYTPDNLLGNSHTANIASGQWAAYTGSDTFLITFQALQTFSTDGVGGLQSQTISSQVDSFITVTYSYTNVVVPEPQTALLGSIGAFAFLRRRRRN